MAGGLNRREPAVGLKRLALAALVLAVLAGHGCVTQKLAEHLAELSFVPAKPARMEVVYVRDMAVGAAPVAAAPAAPPAPEAPQASRAPPTRPAKAASAPERAASRPVAEVADLAQVRQPEPLPEVSLPPVPTPEAAVATPPAPRVEPAEPTVAVSAAAEAERGPASAPTAAVAALAAVPRPSAPGADATAPPFDWPVSTRVSYRLTGNVRGEVNGDAQVEWVRVANRYQVHLDITVGLSFAPLMTRRMSSDGDITPQGLSPRRYDQDTKVGFGARQRVAVLFEPDAVVLSGGQRHERWPGVQDTASQFIQLTYLFSTRPELLRPGGALEVPLALPRSTSRWVYDVVDEETVYTPFGPIAAVHLKPRRAVVKGGDLSAEIWFAPTLRHLPVRIRIQQDAETFIDLVIARKPELAAQ